MFRNYFTTALRHLLKNRLFSVINVFGLAIGLMACILILLFVRDELSFDSWVKDSGRIVRLHTAYISPDRAPFRTVRSAGRMMEAVKAYAPDLVETGVRMVFDKPSVRVGDKIFIETVALADQSFFKVFDLPFVEGSAEASFNKPLDLVISERMARKYFGTSDPVGQPLRVCCVGPKPVDVTVTGVFKDLPSNSHMKFDMLVRMQPAMFDAYPNILNTWNSVNTYTYFKLKPGATVAALNARLLRWLDSESPFLKMVPEGTKPSDNIKLNVMALRDLHLYAHEDAGNMGDQKPLGDMDTVYAFTGVALLILVIASINFMNLSTARAISRAREVAVRKVHGASRLQVACQFLGEAVMITAFALLLALVGVEVALPYYNEAIGRTLTFDPGTDFSLLLGLVCAAVVVGLVSGSYPATYLSGFRPVKVLKANRSAAVDGASRFRAILVVFQFAVSIGLVVCTAVIYAQTSYARTMNLGYVHEGKLVLKGLSRANAITERDALANEFAKLPGITSAVFSSEVPSEDNENNLVTTIVGSGQAKGPAKGVLLNYHSFGDGFFEAYGVKPVAGRTFSRSHSNDVVIPHKKGDDSVGNATAVINESAVRALGFRTPEAALGQALRASLFQAGNYELTIVGVVPDLYFRSVKFGIRPTIYLNRPDGYRRLTLSFRTNDIKGLLANVDRTWNRLVPSVPPVREFLDDMIGAQYQAEEREAQMFAAFSVLAVIVACLGLYGLAAFTAEQRTKEIGIRKVLGATTRDIVQLLIWQFSRPVLIANVIAWPIAWYAMSGWLQAFQYRIGGEYIWILALIAGGMALAIAWVTVASRAIRVARANPIHALRYE
ncbi:ABC transporter permease [Kordiimonas marina]|uniref:ABC transporter permease n=1 Tax=Kordiimonas marina TaxID=2872312 RepID=UPI001FF5DCEF|nr:ABC transporter permease [Kordiimonas marina]MCJ9428006.1 ABC transporter permease [Kordiimonas marina]